MSKIILYSHGGSGNHGCEAIVRGTYNVLKGQIDELYSYRKDEDIKYGLDKLLTVCNHTSKYPRFSLKRIKASILIRLFHNDEYSEKITYDALLNNVNKGDIALSIGGDNYCYTSYKEYALLNKYLNMKGVKTVLWECSINPELIDKVMIDDLKKYSLIVARESISYNALKKVNSNVILSPDPAFTISVEKGQEFSEFFNDDVIGINISPVIIEYSNENDIVQKNLFALIDYILNNTQYKIALIPHVSWDFTNDNKILLSIYRQYEKDDRVILVHELKAEKIKFLISKCSIFIGARTHATIAAYSTCVPTLVIGYSVKAKGIAKDLFGTYKNYVISVQNMQRIDELKNAFIWIDRRKKLIRKHLQIVMPKYIESTKIVYDEIEKLKGN